MMQFTTHFFERNEKNLLEFTKNNTGIKKLSVRSHKNEYYVNTINKELSKLKNLVDITHNEYSTKF